MNKDKALEELFLAHKPHFDDSDAFIASLTKRLDAVEYIKQHQEETIRRYKMAMVVALVIGIISGAITMALVLSMPTDVPLFTFFAEHLTFTNSPMLSNLLLWLTDNSRLIAAALLSSVMALASISIINNIQDIKKMSNYGRV